MESNYRNLVSCAVTRNENRNKQETALTFTKKDVVNDFYLPCNIYLFKVNKRNTRKRCEIWLMLTIRHRSDVFTVNFEHISPRFLVFVSIVDFEQVNGS